EWSAPILRARAGLSRTTAQMRSQWIVHGHAVVREACAISQIGRHRGAGRREWNHLLPSLVAHENEILVLAYRSANHAAKLVLVVPALPQTVKVVLETVGIVYAVTEVFINISVPVVRTLFYYGVD